MFIQQFSPCVSPLFDELLDRLSPRLEKEQTFLRTPLTPGLKLALTLRHFASGHTYSSMKFSWRVPHNTISVVVREVCQAIIDEFLDKLMTCPTTPQGWQEVADRFLQRWNFPHTCGAVDGKHLACRCPLIQALRTLTTRGSTPSCCLPWLMLTISFCGQISVAREQPPMRKCTMTVS